MKTITIGPVSFPLREDWDFSWLPALGEPFAVFAGNDSGNVSFGVEKDGERFFVKCAGARPMEYGGDPADAVARLRAAQRVYEDLRHPALIQYLRPMELPEGLALVFRWAEGECLHDHWNFDWRPKLTDPASPYRRFRALPLAEKREAVAVILDFLETAERAGYAAVDFYDSSLLYDFAAHRLTLCDVDLFQKKPLWNTWGADWPCSPRLAAPEDREKGAVIDSRTDVFHLGRLLLILLAGEDHPDRAHWEETEARWRAVRRATRPDRAARFPSARAFAEAWRAGG